MFAAVKTAISLGLAIALLGWGQNRVPSGASFRDRTFEFYHEFYGPQAFLNPEASANFRNRMANGVSLQPPLNSGLVDFVTSRGINLMVDLPIQSRRDLTPFVFNVQQKAVQELAGADVIEKLMWNLMPEWDQSGGNWVPDGRPRYRGLTKTQAYGRFLEYYYSAYPSLFSFLETSVTSRKHWLTAITDHPSNTFYAYEMGADVCLLERSIDELGDISTGIPFIRGAGRQYDRQWGIDVATYRTSNGMATRFDSREVLLGGWSPSYLKRHYYIAYMAGAHILRNQATGYYGSGAKLDPFGRMNKDFADFALNRHPDVGRPVVTTALLLARSGRSVGDPPRGPGPRGRHHRWQHRQAEPVAGHPALLDRRAAPAGRRPLLRRGERRGQAWVARYCSEHDVDLQRRQGRRPRRHLGGDTALPCETRGAIGLADQLQLDPLALLDSLAQKARAHGARLYEPVRQLPFVGPVLPGVEENLVAGGYAKWGVTNGIAAALSLTVQITG